MYVSEDLNINEKGNLTIGGVDTVALAEEYGTPLFVQISEDSTKASKSATEAGEKSTMQARRFPAWKCAV